jgi:hypothetical protein
LSADADARINLTLNDEASAGVTAAANEINSSLGSVGNSADDTARRYRQFRKENLQLGREFQISHRTLFDGMRVMQGVGRVAGTAVHAFNTWNIAQIRVSEANERVTDTQKALNEAILSGDPEAIAEAQQAHADAVKALGDATLQTNLQLGLLALQTIPSLFTGVVKLIPEIKNLAASLGLMNAAGAAGGAGALAKGTKLTGALGGLSAGAGATGLAALGGKIKGFAGSTAGKVLLPLAAGVATYEFLTETPEGKEVNKFNPFRALGDLLFMATHTPEEVAAAQRSRALAEAGIGAGAGAAEATAPIVYQSNTFNGYDKQQVYAEINDQQQNAAAYD